MMLADAIIGDAAVGRQLFERVWKMDSTLGWAAHKASLESVYACLGVTCADIGVLS